MKKFDWEKEKKTVEKNSIEQHERLHKLFTENRFAFEIERKKMINEIIDSAPDEDQKNRLRTIQNSWDNRMKSSGSEQNRFVLAQYLFWDHFENIWNPTLQECSKELSTLVGGKK